MSFHMSSSKRTSTLNVFAPMQAAVGRFRDRHFPSLAESTFMTDAEVRQWLTNLRGFESSMAATYQSRLNQLRSQDQEYISANPEESQLFIKELQEGICETQQVASRLSDLATAPDIDFRLAESLIQELNRIAKNFDAETLRYCSVLMAAKAGIHAVLEATLTGTIEAGTHTGSNCVPQPNNGLLSFFVSVESG